MRLFERGDAGHHPFHKPGALPAVSPNAALTPEDTWPDGPLRRIAGRLHPAMPHERPQGLPPLQDVATRPFRLGDATGLAPSSRRAISRRIGRIEVRKLACANVPSQTRCHQWHSRRAGVRKAAPSSAERPPCSIIASMSRSRSAQHRCRRPLG
jgi:hypothetical protein